MSNAFNQDFGSALLTLSTLTTNATSGTFSNNTCRGVVVYINVTSLGGGAPTAVVSLLGIDPVGGGAAVLGANTALTLTLGEQAVTFYPGVPVGTNSANEVVPHKWAVKVTAGGTGSITGTVSACLVV